MVWGVVTANMYSRVTQSRPFVVGRSAYSESGAGRAVNGHKRLPGSLHRIRAQLFFRIHNHIGRRGAVGAKKCRNRTIGSEPAALAHADRPK